MSDPGTTECRSILIRGVVQGVGFRPFVHRLANSYGFNGFVRNTGGTVQIVAQGLRSELDAFEKELVDRPPCQAVIAACVSTRTEKGNYDSFRVIPSCTGDADLFVPPDVGTCHRCRHETLGSSGRRTSYAFTTCADCGPRYSIIEELPFDRERTSMAIFARCRLCDAEYLSIEDRRYHAETIACPSCGPQWMWHARGGLADGDAQIGDVVNRLAVEACVAELLSQEVIAIKGIGGLHLACDACSEEAVAQLRKMKHRPDRPLAVMVATLDAARALVDLSSQDETALTSAARPVVVAPQRKMTSSLAPSVARGLQALGIMLPYSPLHELLLRAVGRPLVLTSANLSGAPLAAKAAEVASLSVAGVLDHNREIVAPCDDSVIRTSAQGPIILRNGRGYAPTSGTVKTPFARSVFAAGGHMKAAVAFGDRDRWLVGPHVGDLDDLRTLKRYEKTVAHLEQLTHVKPELLVADQHPEYASTSYARQKAKATGLPLLCVQHHHAHIASTLFEKQVDQAVIGLAFDGTGYGTDGTIWGGEVLLGRALTMRRVARLDPVRLIGGDRAIRQPWRVALAHAHAADETDFALAHLKTHVRQADLLNAKQILKAKLGPMTSSLGRLFDGVAALLGLCCFASYDGQPAILLEDAASCSDDLEHYTLPVEDHRILVGALFSALCADLKRGTVVPVVARRFHNSLSRAFAQLCQSLAHKENVSTVAFGGGVFCNSILSAQLETQLVSVGLRVLRPKRLPPNDGGLCLGQLAIAHAHLEAGDMWAGERVVPVLDAWKNGTEHVHPAAD